MNCLVSAKGFLRIQVTIADLRDEGTIPEMREEWTIAAIRGGGSSWKRESGQEKGIWKAEKGEMAEI